MEEQERLKILNKFNINKDTKVRFKILDEIQYANILDIYIEDTFCYDKFDNKYPCLIFYSANWDLNDAFKDLFEIRKSLSKEYNYKSFVIDISGIEGFELFFESNEINSINYDYDFRYQKNNKLFLFGKNFDKKEIFLSENQYVQFLKY